jgi:hypothetical protein
VLAPVLFAASLYMTVARIIRLTGGEKYSLVSPQWTTKIFVTCDVLTFLVQVGGTYIQYVLPFKACHSSARETPSNS